MDRTRYYARELAKRLRHYASKRLWGYRDWGSLEVAAANALARRAERGFDAGGHFDGVWPRDLCFAAPGLSMAGYGDAVREVGGWLVDQLSTVFYTDFQRQYRAATPAEGVDTFPALVVVLAECGRLEAHADAVAEFAALHREKFFDEDAGIVSGAGSSWIDSAAEPREAYNTAMVLAAIDRLEEAAVDTTYTGRAEAIREAFLETLWNGRFFDEHRRSSVLACDANVVPLYFGLVDDDRARRIARSLDALATPCGTRLRARPFSLREVHPFFLLHRDYHAHVWPWNGFAYAIGLERYGLTARADLEVARLECVLGAHGNFLEVVVPDGTPYVKRGYASAEDFAASAALWLEYRQRYGDLDPVAGSIDDS